MLTPDYSLLTTPKLLVMLGATATGKSDIAMKLAQKYNGEIICADSRTVYRYMDIGTAKPSRADMLLIKHHLVNIKDPNERFNASEFKKLALATIENIAGRGKLPIMVGGTGLYIDSVLFDYQFPTSSSDKPFDQAQDKRVVSSGMSLEGMIAELSVKDPSALLGLDLKNSRRVARALETVGSHKSKDDTMRANTLVLGMAMDKKVIQERITHRIKKMLSQGLIDEVKFVGDKFGWDREALTGPAYVAFRKVVLGQKTIQEGVDDFARRDMALVKKQLTWFKRNDKINWVEVLDQADELVKDFLAE